ncbi:hypothetical protein LUZ60_008456 [Juncus effusus]|nr:hypothetical protein LUZ60_008456 [Juncus effusus]
MVVASGTAVGWLVSPVIKIMIEKARSYVSDQYSWSSNMKEDLKKLENNLTKIMLVVDRAEMQKIAKSNQAMLLRKMKNVVYEAEDVMDEFDYILLKEKVEKKRMATYLAFSSLSLGKRLVGLDEFRPKLKNVIKKLQIVEASAEMFLQVMGTENSTSAIRQTNFTNWRVTSSVSHEVLIGRDEERDRLIEMLLEPRREVGPEQNNTIIPHVISLVGDGGMGKTTLAQTVYNSKQITRHFDRQMWICVSEKFEKTKLAEKILVAVTDNKSIMLENYSYDSVHIELKKALDTKKFLLVLDDVWYDENIGRELYKDTWKELFFILGNTNRKSKILVTTRMKIVAEMLESSNLFPLVGLRAKDSWLLFSKFALRNHENPGNQLKDIGKQIVDRLAGSPLAIKVIGGQLNANLDVEEWDRVLKSDLSKSNDIMTILRLSYEHLPEQLQRCFAYCSLFPKDWNLDSEKLVDMWIAQGFITQEESGDRSLERIGRDYFNELSARSFLQELKRGEKKFYVMHDLMNDLALHVSEGECIRVERERVVLPTSVRHLSIDSKKLDKLTNVELDGLRTLIILEDSVVCSKVVWDCEILKEFKGMRVLDLSGCCLDKIPKTIDRLVHLRYLAIKRTSHPLPKSVYNLYHLQVLTILYHSCHLLPPYMFSKSITNLISLSHVDVVGAYAVILDGMQYLSCLRADGVLHVKKKNKNKLTELRDKIKCVDGVFNGSQTSENRLVVLKDKNKIRGKLSIKSLQNVKSLTEAKEAQLDCKGDITELELEFNWNEASDQEQIDVLEVLKPHRNLEKLVVKGSPGAKSPSWLETDWLNRVKVINVSNCNWELLPPLGKLPFLNDLKVTKNSLINRIGTEFYGSGIFPSLERLCFEELSQLEEWLGADHDIQLFPNLQQLLISGCNQLTKIPPLYFRLEYFSVCEITRLRMYQQYKENYLDFLHAVNDRSIPSRPLFDLRVRSGFFLDSLHVNHLNALQILDIDFKSNISMIKRILQLIKSQEFLKELIISNVSRECGELILTEHKHEWSDALPTSLQSLKIHSCNFKCLVPVKLEKLISLKKLELFDCRDVERSSSQPTFILPCFTMLESLTIDAYTVFISLPDLENYPVLEKLELHRCKTSQNTLTNSDHLPRLKKLSLRYCDNLEILPDLDGCPALEYLSIHSSALKTLINSGYSVNLKSLHLHTCDQITTLEELQGLVSLTDLLINDCPQLSSLPIMGNFYSLIQLSIHNCPAFNALPRTGLPVSLEILQLVCCHLLLHEQFENKKGREWNKVAAIVLKGLSYCDIGPYRLLFEKRDPILQEREMERKPTSSFTKAVVSEVCKRVKNLI